MVSNFIIQALGGQDITLYGHGSQTRVFCYVDDLIEGMVRLIDADGVTGPVNLGHPHEITVRTLAETILALTGSASRIVYKPLPQDDPVQRCPDIDLAKRILGWAPRMMLAEGLAETITYFRGRLDLAA